MTQIVVLVKINGQIGRLDQVGPKRLETGSSKLKTVSVTRTHSLLISDQLPVLSFQLPVFLCLSVPASRKFFVE
jgi:hypothetical protein